MPQETLKRAIVTTRAIHSGSGLEEVWCFEWYVISFDEKEILLADKIDSTEAIAVPRKDVLALTYLD